jgi:3-hydroxyisobutyrate dehydrogenase-like beta-hydroxyacid dehydrogenase
MGSGLAKNLIANGIETVGYDVAPARVAAFEALGGAPGGSVAGVGGAASAVFVMVMTGDQAKAVILGDGLVSAMAPGGVIILTATIKPHEAREIAGEVAGTGIDLVDSPVSGGFPGAQSGTLTMMAAGSDAAMDTARPSMEAVSRTIHRVGTEPGMGHRAGHGPDRQGLPAVADRLDLRGHLRGLGAGGQGGGRCRCAV